MIARLALLALAVSGVASADPLTVAVGESWAFRVDQGEPVAAHKIAPASKPKRGEIKVTVSPMAGTTMTLTNNSGQAYTYRADLVGLPAGNGRTCTLPADSDPVLEYWPRRANAIRLSDFKATGDTGSCPQNR